MAVTLFGFYLSVYNRIARMTLVEKAVPYERREVNPFNPDMPMGYLEFHPFQRVPVLEHDGFRLFETGAICRYVDTAFPGPRLQPDTAKGGARMNQVMHIVDAYGYWPLVRQVYAHRVSRPQHGLEGDETEIAQGLEKSATVLAVLENIADEGHVLSADAVSLADLHLAPMIAYFTATPEGQALFADYPALVRWWSWMEKRASFLTTEPLETDIPPAFN